MNDSHYCPHTPEEIADMLSAIGVASVEELFAPIPAELRAKTFNLPAVAVFGSSGIAQFAEKGVTVHQPLMDTYKQVKAMEIKYDQFGWKDGETRFLCGDRMYTGGVGDDRVSVSKVAEGRVKYLGLSSGGNLADWRNAATSFFKPGYESQAFTLVVGLAAPFMAFIDRSEGGTASTSIYGLEKGLRPLEMVVTGPEEQLFPQIPHRF